MAIATARALRGDVPLRANRTNTAARPIRRLDRSDRGPGAVGPASGAVHPAVSPVYHGVHRGTRT